MAAKDMTGARFGLLTVVRRGANLKCGTARWHCVCDCGQERLVEGTGLRAGRNKSCGCASPRFTSERAATHGMAGTRTYRIWLGMLARCSSQSQGKTRSLYFDKGIRVCERWAIFENFLEDMGEAPDGLSIDRIDGDLGYQPGNCRWATAKQQANNTSANHVVTFGGRSKTVAQWAEEIGVKQNTLLHRLRRGVPLERAMQPKLENHRTAGRLARSRPCLVCGSSFIPRPRQLASGHGKYCSQACNGAARKMENMKRDELSCLNDTVERLLDGR